MSATPKKRSAVDMLAEAAVRLARSGPENGVWCSCKTCAKQFRRTASAVLREQAKSITADLAGYRKTQAVSGKTSRAVLRAARRSP